MRIIAFIVALLVAAAASWAGFGDIISSFRAPSSYPIALGWDGNYLWCYCNASPYNFYRINPANGSVVYSFPSNTSSRTRGLTWDGTYLYTGAYSPNYVYARNTAGSIYRSFSLTSYYGGLTFDGTYLWANSTSPRAFYTYNLNGSLIRSFSVTFYPFDPGWDGTYLICGTYSPSHMLYRLTTTGSIVQSASPPANYPWGCTFDGKYIWVSTTVGTNYIYKLDPGFVAVSPASLGKVKAVFR
jgi:hypothetical protein